MGLESGTYINDLVTSNPVGGVDPKSEGDDHIRLIKAILKNTFPGLAGIFARVQAKATAYTVVANDNTTLIDCSAALTLSLTAAASLGNGHTFGVYARGGNVTIDPNGAETINAASTLVVASGDFAIVWCNGSAFYALSLSNYLKKSGGTMTGKLVRAVGANIASASTVDLTAATGDIVHITGTTTITAFTMNAGQEVTLIFDAAVLLTYHATTLNIPGGGNKTTTAGDRVTVWSDGTTVYVTNYQDSGSLGGGARGGGGDDVFYENSQTVNNDYTITSGKNAMSAGPITIASGKTVTVPSGSVWVVV